ncbi:MAG: beta-ketoacyl-ACP synthase 3 [Bacteroidales bacterium]|nr:beta-ketoacyl-ACP synthase 3 [Bacteroidales bacterium]
MKILGTGSAIPRKVVTNDMLSEFLDTSDAWIVPRTGIHSRHVITDEQLEDLGTKAALNALEMSGLSVADIDYFICSNVVGEYVTPSLSCVIASKIGLTCPCVDINCACPGFIYALDIAESRYLAGKSKNILIVCAEEPTRMCDWSDRSTAVLFGDGAGAVVLGEGNNIKGVELHSQPDVQKIWEKRVLEKTPYISKEEENVPLQMRGREVFKFAVNASTRDVESLLSSLGMTKDDVNYYMVHQANMRIIEAIKQYLGERDEKFPTNIGDHGNSSSASCPILLDECNRKGLFKKGDVLVFSAFGAGLLSGVAVLEW